MNAISFYFNSFTRPDFSFLILDLNGRIHEYFNFQFNSFYLEQS